MRLLHLITLLFALVGMSPLFAADSFSYQSDPIEHANAFDHEGISFDVFESVPADLTGTVTVAFVSEHRYLKCLATPQPAELFRTSYLNLYSQASYKLGNRDPLNRRLSGLSSGEFQTRSSAHLLRTHPRSFPAG